LYFTEGLRSDWQVVTLIDAVRSKMKLHIIAGTLLVLLLAGCNGALSTMEATANGKPIRVQKTETCVITVTGTSGNLTNSTLLTIHLKAAKLDKGCSWD
jgi:hypothetical protein